MFYLVNYYFINYFIQIYQAFLFKFVTFEKKTREMTGTMILQRRIFLRKRKIQAKGPWVVGVQQGWKRRSQAQEVWVAGEELGRRWKAC